MPKKGFTAMFKKMISNKNIKISLNKKYSYSSKDLKYNIIVYTGPIDAFFKINLANLAGDL